MNADELKANVAAYWRYTAQCPLVALEAWSNLQTYGELADVLCVGRDRLLIETEVKISLSDLKKDREKSKHHFFHNAEYGRTHQFYFAVPLELGNQARPIVDELFPYAGLLGFEKYASTTNVRAEHFKRAKELSNKPLDIKDIVKMSLNQSATLCRIAMDLAESRNTEHRLRGLVLELQSQIELLRGVN